VDHHPHGCFVDTAGNVWVAGNGDAMIQKYDPAGKLLLQIGLAVMAPDGTIVDRWSTLVRLRWPLQRVGPTSVHGIRRRTLRGAPTLDDSLGELARRIDGLILVAHNVAFDSAFLRHAARKRVPALNLGPRLCTLELSRALDPDHELSHALIDVAARYGVRVDRPHDALCDALAAAAILPPLLDAHGIDRTTPPDRLRDEIEELARRVAVRTTTQGVGGTPPQPS
jgi:DNA polymerase-3 subunit epsilon